METRGLRNNNPLNIRRIVGTVWKGQLAEQNDPKFVQFSSMEWGIRAAFVILQTYRRKYNATCVEEIIGRWAPKTENNTAEYINGICRLTGYGEKERLSERDWPALVKAMALIESRMHLDEAVLRTAYNLYLNLKR